MRSSVLVIAGSFALGCSSSEPSSGPAAGGSAGWAGTGGGDGGSAVGADEQRFQDLLAGLLEPEAALGEIARSGGFPIETAAGPLFARLDDGGGPYSLAGDFNAWSPEPMTAQAGVYWRVRAVPSPDGARYKFVDGGGTFHADPLARRYDWDDNGEISLVRASAPHRERFPGVAGQGRPARTVRVWVPGSAPTHHLYAHDGQNLFEPDAPFGGWRLHQSAGKQTLIVAIDNTGAGRMDEYTHVPDDIGSGPVGGHADAYADFVELTVRPLVEQRYGAPTRTGVMGSSLGGLVSVHLMLRHPGRYDFVAALSGTFGWGSIGPHSSTLIERLVALGKQPSALYLDSGGGPGSGCVDSDGDGILDDSADAKDNYCETLQLYDVAAGTGYQPESDLFHWHEPGAPHNEAAWAARAFRPLGLFEAP